MREFCEFWRSKRQQNTATDDTKSDENTQILKVSKRKVEAKIREIAMYEFRPQTYKRKLWYVNDGVLEKLNLSLPVPTEWKWITLVSTKTTEADNVSVGKPSICVSSVEPSPTTPSGTIKSFMSSVTASRSHQQNSAPEHVTMMKGSSGVGQSPSQCLQQSPSENTSKAQSDCPSSSPVCTPIVCDNGAAGTKPSSAPTFRTPCSSSAAKKRKIQSARSCNLPTKRQPCLLFSKKLPQPANDDDCMVVDSCVVSSTSANADEPRARPGDVKALAHQPADDDDCMIVESCVIDSESGSKSDVSKDCAKLDVVATVISDVKPLPETDANSNVCMESSLNEANKPVDMNNI